MKLSEFCLYRYRGTVSRIIDGDTIEVFPFDLGDRTFRVRRIRLLGYDAEELFSGTDREAGAAARDALGQIIPVGSRIYIATQLDRTSFDRLLGTVYAPGNGDELLDVAEAMIAGGFGAPP